MKIRMVIRMRGMLLYGYMHGNTQIISEWVIEYIFSIPTELCQTKCTSFPKGNRKCLLNVFLFAKTAYSFWRPYAYNASYTQVFEQLGRTKRRRCLERLSLYYNDSIKYQKLCTKWCVYPRASIGYRIF